MTTSAQKNIVMWINNKNMLLLEGVILWLPLFYSAWTIFMVDEERTYRNFGGWFSGCLVVSVFTKSFGNKGYKEKHILFFKNYFWLIYIYNWKYILGNINFLVYKNAPQGCTFVRKEDYFVTRTRRRCFAYAKHFLGYLIPLFVVQIFKLRR